jgi:hypothetical protein
MWGIPEWAIGAGFITTVVFVGIGLMYRLLPPEARQSKRHGLSDRERDLLADLPRRVEAAERLETRLADVEERLEFAERLLAQERDDKRLAGPPH